MSSSVIASDKLKPQKIPKCTNLQEVRSYRKTYNHLEQTYSIVLRQSIVIVTSQTKQPTVKSLILVSDCLKTFFSFLLNCIIIICFSHYTDKKYYCQQVKSRSFLNERVWNAIGINFIHI